MKTQPTNRTRLALLLFCIFSININVMIAQDGVLDICVTPENTETDSPGVHSYSKSLEVLANMDPVVVNVFYWSINDPEGIAGPLPDDFKPALFQPGFSYMFKDCCCGYPQPSDFEDTSFTVGSHAVKYVDKTETDFETITHPNHAAFQILQLPSIIPPFRKCYDNWNKAAIGGSVTKFNDNIFNSNVTITAQDSTNINNPNLTNTLDPGLYKIEKVYEDGAVQQNVIYKNNNE